MSIEVFLKNLAIQNMFLHMQCFKRANLVMPMVNLWVVLQLPPVNFQH